MRTLQSPGRRRPSAWALVAPLLFLSACGGGGGGDTVVIPPFWLASGVAVADLDANGLADVALANTYVAGPPPHAGYVDVRLQRAPGVFDPPVRYPVAADPWNLSVGDVDGDGRPDLVAASPMTMPVAINAVSDSGVVSLLRQDPAAPGRFVGALQLATGGIANEAAIADADGDGRADLAVADGVVVNSRVRRLLQNPAQPGQFLAATSICTGSGEGMPALVAGDVDGDGRADLVLAAGDRVLLCRQLAGGAFAAPETVGTGTGVSAVALADLDADGRLDIVAAAAGLASSGGTGASAVLVLRQTAPGVFSQQTHPVADGARRVALGDLNQDGRPDIAAISIVYQSQANSTRVTVLLQSATVPGTFAANPALEGPYGGNFIALGDIDGDARPDLVVNDGPSYFRQDPANPGRFLPWTVLP